MSAVADMTWDAVEARLSGGAPALLAIGAASKEHGLHLPMNTDAVQAEWLCREVAKRTGALWWPPLTYGFYPAFTDFPGSITLTGETFQALLHEVSCEILRWKPNGLFVLDTGVSTLKPAAQTLARIDNAFHVPVVEGRRYREVANRLGEQVTGSHADELETSHMLAIAPGVVDMTRAKASPPGEIPGALTRQNAPSGSYGDPTLASLEKGEAVATAKVKDCVEAVQSLAKTA